MLRRYWILVVLIMLLGTPPATSRAQDTPTFTISGDFFPGEMLAVSGDGLAPNTTYILSMPNAGVDTVYDGDRIGDRDAQLVVPPGQISTDAAYSININDIGQILWRVEYYAQANTAIDAPLLYFRADDIYAVNVNVFQHESSHPILELNTWQSVSLLLDPSVGMLGATRQWLSATEGIDLYVGRITKQPVWVVQTNADGSFSQPLRTPRRMPTVGNDDAPFELVLYTADLNNPQRVGTIEQSVDYSDYLSIRDMIDFHYRVVRPESTLTDRSAAVYANQVDLGGRRFRADWEIGYMGAVYTAIGADDLATEQAYRLCATQTGNGEIGVVRNHTDSAIAGYYTIRPVYEATGDPILENCLLALAEYTVSNYRADYDVYPQFTGNEYWADAMGVGKTFFLAYMAQRFDNPAWQQAADDIMWYALTHLRTDEGYFRWRYNFVDDTIVSDWWIGAQGWALMGMIEYAAWTDDADLLAAMDAALPALANYLVAQPYARLREDILRSSQIAYYLLRLSEDERYDTVDRAQWQILANDLFFDALRDKSSDTSLDYYGLTLASITWSFVDMFLLAIMDEFYPDTAFYLNPTDTDLILDVERPQGHLCLPMLVDGITDSVSPYHGIVADADGYRLVGRFDAGWLLSCTTQSAELFWVGGSSTVRLDIWQPDAGLLRWEIDSTADAVFSLRIGRLMPTTAYMLLRDGELLYEQTTDADGVLLLQYTGAHRNSFYTLLPSSQ